MNFSLRFLILFLVLNLGALALGNWLMGTEPVQDAWYVSANRAPWEPPGWVFGAVWTLIMICFSVFLMIIFSRLTTRGRQTRRGITVLYTVQWFLNVSWNAVFFRWHLPLAGLIVLLLLFFVLWALFIKGRVISQSAAYLLLPYLIWMLVAISLNGYFLLHNG